MATRRKLVSTSTAANTGMHGSIPAASFAGDEITVCFWWKTPSASDGNPLNTVWASQTGEYQIYTNSSGNENEFSARMDGSKPTAGRASPGAEGDWVFVWYTAGIDHNFSDDVRISLTDGTTTESANRVDSGSPADDLTAAHTQYVLGDDANGSPTDDGFKGEIFDLCVFDGIISDADLNHDGSGEWKDLSATAKAALVYRLDGQNASDPGEDSSGNGNDFTVESSGVTLSDTDLPPGANPAGGTETITGDGHDDADAFGSGSVAPGAVGISGAGHEDADTFGAGTISASITISGLAFADPDGFGSGSVSPGAAGISGDGHEDADGFGAGSVSAGLAQILGAGHADPDAFGGGAVASGPIQISGVGFLDGDAFGAGSVVPGPIQISGVGHVDTDGFGSGVVAAGEVIGGAGHVDPDTFGSGLVAAGAVTIEGVAHVDPDAFGAGAVTVDGGPLSILGAGHADPDAFGEGDIAPGPVQIGGAGHSEPDAFGAGRIDIRITGTIYVGADAFGSGQIATGDVIIVGTAFVDPDAFGSGMAGDGTVIAPVDPTRVIRLVREPRASALREARLVAFQRESRVLASSRRLP